jgi:hypothetical protein
MNRVPIGATIGAAFNYIGVAWRQAWLAMAFLVGLQALQEVLRIASPRAAGIVSFVALIPLIAFGTVALGALYRIGLERSSDPEFRPGTGGVQWNGLEWRVLGANLLVGVILALVAFVCFFILIMAVGVSLIGHMNEANAVNAAGNEMDRLAAVLRLMQGPTGLVTLAIGLVSLALLIWLNAKLSLFAIFAADTRSFDLVKAWTMTRGATWALIVTTLVILVTQALVTAVFGLAGLALAGVAGAYAAAIGSLLGALASTAISNPLAAGMQVAVYRARRPGASAVAETFN